MKNTSIGFRTVINFKDGITDEEINELNERIITLICKRMNEIIVMNKDMIIDPEKAIVQVGEPLRIDYDVLNSSRKTFEEQTT